MNHEPDQVMDRRAFLQRMGLAGTGAALVASMGQLPAGSEVLVPRVKVLEPELVRVPPGPLGLTGLDLGAGWVVHAVTMQHYSPESWGVASTRATIEAMFVGNGSPLEAMKAWTGAGMLATWRPRGG